MNTNIATKIKIIQIVRHPDIVYSYNLLNLVFKLTNFTFKFVNKAVIQIKNKVKNKKQLRPRKVVKKEREYVFGGYCVSTVR